MRRIRPLAVLSLLLAGPIAAGPAGAQATAAAVPATGGPAQPDYAGFPCLSYTHACAKLATRRMVAKPLEGPLNGDAGRGRQLAQARDKGNCLACHVMQGGAQPGTRGPDLSHYGSSGRSDAETFTAVYDMRTRNPETLMPPFGTNEVLTEPEIRDIVAFLQASR